MAVYDLTLPDLSDNLALDEALLIDAERREARGVLRFWEQPDFGVVLGASRKLRDEVHLGACLDDNIPIGRRASGGGTVLIGPGALNVTVILPETHASGLSAIDLAQHFVVDGLARSIRKAGLPVEVRGLGDLTLADRKFGGSAQRRLKSHFLVHCSLLYAFPLEKIGRYLAMPGRQPAYRAGRDHGEFVCNLQMSRADLISSIALSGLVDCDASPQCEPPLALMRSLAAEKYGDRAWTERF